MYLNLISDFTAFLSGRNHTLEEILNHLVRVVLVPLEVEALSLKQLNANNEVETIAQSGMPLEISQQYVTRYNLSEKYPTTDTLRYRRTTWINTLPDWGDDYPLLKNVPHTTGAKSYIVFPIERAGTPVASLGLYSRMVIHPDAEIEAFLKAIGSVFSMHMYRASNKIKSELQTVEDLNHSSSSNVLIALTDRQLIILRLMSEENTNLQISELLGYSESTIKQESIKIYSKLGCDSRFEAVQIFQQQSTKSTES